MQGVGSFWKGREWLVESEAPNCVYGHIVKYRNASSKHLLSVSYFTKHFVSAAMNENHVRVFHKSLPRLGFLFAKVSGEHTADCPCVSNGFHHPKISAALWSVPWSFFESYIPENQNRSWTFVPYRRGDCFRISSFSGYLLGFGGIFALVVRQGSHRKISATVMRGAPQSCLEMEQARNLDGQTHRTLNLAKLKWPVEGGLVLNLLLNLKVKQFSRFNVPALQICTNRWSFHRCEL